MRDIEVEVVVSVAPRQVQRARLLLPSGTSVLEAVQRSGLLNGWDGRAGDPCTMPAGWRLAVWGRPVEGQVVLRPGDRIEICRPLKADPKESRRQRYQAHLARWGKRRPNGTRSG